MTSRRPCWCPKTMKRRPCWCPKPVLWELNSFLMQTLSFVPIYLHRCWPRDWKHSIQQEELMERRPNGGSYENHNSSYRSTFQWNFDEGEGNLVRIHLYLGLNFVAKNKCWLIFFSNFRTNIFKRNCLQKGKEEIANIVRITNSTAIASCSKHKSNKPQDCICKVLKTCWQKSKKSQKQLL